MLPSVTPSRSLVVAAALWAAACSSTDQGPARSGGAGGGGSNTGGTATAGASPGGSSSGGSCADCPDAAAGQSGSGGSSDSGAPWLPATQGTTELPFKLSATGSGTTRLTDVDVKDNHVTLTLSGATHRGLVYTFHDWTAAGYTLYDVVSIAEDGSDLAVTYLYCVGSDLQYAYTESFQHALDWEPMSGVCDVLMAPHLTQVDLPALAALPSGFNSGVSISGEGIDVSPTGGSIELQGSAWDLTPFATVDCTDCPDGPWLEVHSLLRKPGQGCFGILYLFPEQPTRVDFTNAVCLPDLTRPAQGYAATWSGSVPFRGSIPLGGNAAQAGRGSFWRPAPRLPPRLP